MIGYYDAVLLDSAFFEKPFSDRAKYLLLNNRVCISDTFLSEIDSYCSRLRMIGGTTYLNTLNQNLDFFFDLVDKYKVSSDGCSRNLWEMITDSERLFGSICVITDDRLLISRIVNAGLRNVEICSNIDEIDFSALCSRKSFEIREDTEGDMLPEFTPKTTLRGENQRTIHLGEQIGEDGKEGYVMMDADDPETVIKLYFFEPCAAKVSHIRSLIRLKNESVPWCLFPKEAVYYQDKVIGFSMPRCNGALLISNKLYEGIGNDCEKKSVYLNRNLSYTIRLCIMLLTQIKFLNARYGIAVFDFNTKNFSNYTPGYPLTFFDADSFMDGGLFFDDSLADDYFSRDYGNDFESLIQLSYEAALKLVFELFSLGYPPIVGYDEGFCFADEGPHSVFSYKKLYFPKKIYRLMEDVFTCKREASVDSAIHALIQVKNYLDNHPAEDLTYRQITAYAADAKKRMVSPREIADIPKGKTPGEPTRTPPQGQQSKTPPQGQRPTPPPQGQQSKTPPQGQRPTPPPQGQRPTPPPQGQQSKTPPQGQRPTPPPQKQRLTTPPPGQKSKTTVVAENKTGSSPPTKTFNFGKLFLGVICAYLIICAICVGTDTDWAHFDLFVFIGDVLRFAYRAIVDLITSIGEKISILFSS